MWPSLNTVFQWVVIYRYLILFPIAIIEGPIIAIIAGFLISLRQMNFWIVLVLLVTADMIGDMILYSIGRWGMSFFISRWGSVMGLTEERIEKFEKLFKRNKKKALLFGKWGHAFGAPILLSAGMAKQPIKEFLWINLLGTAPKSVVLILIGFYFGAAYELIDKYLAYAVIIIVALAITIGVFYWIFNDRAKRYFMAAEE